MSEPSGRPLFSLGKRKKDQPPLVRVDGRSLAYFSVVLVMVGLAGWLYLHQASQVASYAHEIRRIERDKEQIHREMIALRAAVAEAGALNHILAQADAAGYSMPKVSDANRMLVLDVPIAPEPAKIAPPEPESSEQDVGDARVGQGMLQELRNWLATDSDE